MSRFLICFIKGHDWKREPLRTEVTSHKETKALTITSFKILNKKVCLRCGKIEEWEGIVVGKS